MIEVRLGRGLGGKSFVILTGSVSDVRTATETARAKLGSEGMIMNIEVIPSMHMDMYKALL